MNRKYIPKDLLLKSLIKRQTELNAFILYEKEHLKNAKTGRLRITTNKSNPQYYLKTEKGDKNGKYIPKSKVYIAKSIAQRDYETCLLETSEKQLALIKDFLNKYEDVSPENCFGNLSLQRKELVSSCIFPNPDYIEKWKNVSYAGKGFETASAILLTSAGLRVRSKSEIIIADALEKYNIPFRYEYPVNLKNFTVYPDFYCLNPVTGDEIIWEHFGFIDDVSYTKNMVKKIAEYQKNGFFPGKNLIITFENAETPLNSKAVAEVINEYFC